MDMDNSSPPEQAASAAAAAAPQKPSMIPTFFKYSKRVLLRDVINNGPDFVGQRVVVGGWVKSSREIKTEAPSNQMIVHQQPNKDFDCVEILQTKLPFFRSFLKVFGMAHNYPVRDKIESHNIPKLLQQQQPSLALLQISDGSSVASLQVLVESSVVSPTSQVMATGTCILVDGLLQQASSSFSSSSTKKGGAGKHTIELKVVRVLHIGTVDQDTYPLSKKKLPLHLLRDSAHFRPRTTTVGSVARIRSALNEGTHNFFQTNGFLFVQVPIITATDCEGSSSQKFQVVMTSAATDVNDDVDDGSVIRKEKKKKKEEVLLEEEEEEEEEEQQKKKKKKQQQQGNYRTTTRGDDGVIISLETIKASIKEKSKQLDELKRSDSNREAVVAATKDLHKTTEIAAQLELDRTKKMQQQQEQQYEDKYLFGRQQAYLTVSGRLHLQSYACALGNVYSCGPRFRADNYKGIRGGRRGGLSESWMSEVEIAFSELEDAIKCAEELVKHVSKWAVEKCMEDLEFLGKRVDVTIVDRLKSNIIGGPFKRMSYTEAVEVLLLKENNKLVEWGRALTEEDESCLAEEIYKKAVIIYNHPKQVKPFYMRLNEDGKTVASFDIIMPKGGRVISGGENEERNGVVKERIKELGMPSSSEYEWYLDLTRQGSVKSSGFSMLFDLLSVHATGLIDLRDVIPFSRTPLQPLLN